MVYYNNDAMSKSTGDKIVSKLIRYSSLSYVAWNPFGNINNYVIARLNNGIEVAGQRYFSAKSYARATRTYSRFGRDHGHRHVAHHCIVLMVARKKQDKEAEGRQIGREITI